jgi:hypothetical protein
VSATVVLSDHESARYVAMRSELATHGYRDVEHPRLRPGRRVRHQAERWPEARDFGTGVLLAVMERTNSPWSASWGGPDIEVIVLRDRPLFPGMSQLSQLANYHVATVGVSDD